MKPDMMACVGENNTFSLCKHSLLSAGEGAASQFGSDLEAAVGHAAADPC